MGRTGTKEGEGAGWGVCGPETAYWPARGKWATGSAAPPRWLFFLRTCYSFPNGRPGTARHGHGPGTARLGTARSGLRACRAVPDSAAVPSGRHGHGTKLSGACRAGPFGTAARSCSCLPRHVSSKVNLFQYRKIHLTSNSTKNQKNTAEHITDSNKKELYNGCLIKNLSR
jgi:hypothetical protein